MEAADGRASIPSPKVWKFALFYSIFCFQIILPSRSGVYRGLADKTVDIIQETILRQLTANKSESSFCSSSRSFLQNEDPLDFVSACSEQSI